MGYIHSNTRREELWQQMIKSEDTRLDEIMFGCTRMRVAVVMWKLFWFGRLGQRIKPNTSAGVEKQGWWNGTTLVEIGSKNLLHRHQNL